AGGRPMKRLIAQAAARFARRPEPVPQLHPDHAIAARAFDAAFYLASYADVAEAGVDPLEHFMLFGWREGRDPSPEFSTTTYLAAFPDVAAAEVNPFVHYLTNGRPKAVPPEHPLGFRYEVIEGLVPLDERVARATAVEAPLTAEAELGLALAQSRDGLRRLHVTFSHDDFTAHLGGLQASIRREAERLAELGRDHLHLHPAKPWPVVRLAEEPGELGVVWNGRSVGTFTPAAVAAAVREACTGEDAGRSFAIHSLLGHAADETADILGAAGLRAGIFWLHDFASLCAGFHLLRDDVEDCAAPPPGSPACGICVYGPGRARHLDTHARLFERLELTVAAPSQATLDLWVRASGLPAVRTVVLPHAALSPRATTPAPRPSEARPFRLAFAGLPVTHKGWPIFRALAARFAFDPRYEFRHLGARRDSTLPVAFEPVGGPDGAPSMTEALAAGDIDAVLVWPLCRETFSFVAYEAVAAGCAVVTAPDSGNVAAFVAGEDRGLVLPDEAALTEAFASGAILELSRAKRSAVRYDLSFSALTLDLPPAQSP
ncbi:MAG TPA: hypothetical protein VFH92_11575, partial [Phenylobacterium sp.]|nr:hypothetical protein [Phenylobacterium sp.]